MNGEKQRPQLNQAGVELIKASEGFFPERYICPAGKPTVGYGHVILAGEVFDHPLSQPEAEELLRRDLSQVEGQVSRLVTAALSDNQFSALLSFTFNVGAGNLASSTLLKKLNAGDYPGAAEQFLVWVKCTKVDAQGNKYKETLPGLVTRRQAERALFLA
jgi:lysozyme